jgi:hypothetical protein
MLGGLGAVALVLVLWGAVTATHEDSQASGFTVKEIEDTVRGAYENELLTKQRAQGARGTISVVRVDCAEGTRRLLTCLAHVVAGGEAKRIARVHGPIGVVRTGRGEFRYQPVPGR